MSKLELKTNFNDDNQSSSFDSPEPIARDGSSRDRNAISAVVSFIGGLRRDSVNQGPGKNDSKSRNHNERYNENWGKESLRDNLRQTALVTLRILDDGEYFPPGQDGPYDLTPKILWTNENTRYYGPKAGEGGEILKSEFIKINGGRDGRNTGAGVANNANYLNEARQGAAAAASKPDNDDNANPKVQTRVQATASPYGPDPQRKATLHNTQTPIYIGEYSTLVGARKVYRELARNTDPSINKKIGVLNFASAKKPGGGFIVGCQAQVRFVKLSYPSYDIKLTNLLIRKSL